MCHMPWEKESFIGLNSDVKVLKQDEHQVRQ